MKNSKSSNKISFPSFFLLRGHPSYHAVSCDGIVDNNYLTEQHFFSSAFLKAILVVINNLNILWAIAKTLPTTYMGLASLAVHADY